MNFKHVNILFILYKIANVNLAEKKEDKRLSLRKQKIDNFIFKKKERILERNNKSSENCNLFIKPENLNLPAEIINYDAKNIEDYFEFIFNLLKSDNFTYIKFGIYLIRKQLTIENNPPILELCDKGLVHQLLSNLEMQITDEQVVVRENLNFLNF